MKNIYKATKTSSVVFALSLLIHPRSVFASQHIDECNTSFFGIPAWHNGLTKTKPPECAPIISGFGDITTILVNVIQMGLRVAVVVALVMIMLSGIKYTTSSGNPEATKKATKTLSSAIAGLAIAVLSTTLISVIVGRFI